jgi:hypothetical protein
VSAPDAGPGRLSVAEAGSKGGKARAERLSAARRSEIARKAARARWARKKARPRPGQRKAGEGMSERHRNAHAALVDAAEAYLSCDPGIDYWEDIVESHSNCGCDWCATATRVLAARKALRAALALAKGETP